MWTWQKSCPGTALFRHRCPALVSPRHGVRGVSEDLGRGGKKKTISTTAPKRLPVPQKHPRSLRCPLSGSTHAVLLAKDWLGL